MRLTKSTDIALRIAMRLAVTSGGAETTAPTTREVAAAVGVPYTHAAKVVSRMTHLGVVETRRGRGGGLALTTLGLTGSVGRLVRALEGSGDVVGCEDDPPCPLRGACRLRGALRDAQEAFFAALDPITVQDLVRQPTGPVLLSLTARPEDGPDPHP
ncbi:Rrf2 family transcriptional regulator [Streptomyces mobaraensis NBRC 13819 = DSM 40847]|uniref:HTH-type transcriptional repressor nsrR n=1 Tax=Streptomyces mobaraensis (strain ATCC 29032 / DSM 40847 / JCM 4168 / NBRC 13819 / NCIMB 11159 / IPCR 16-22) TaxID=1223523 RepID=M3BQR5_STRM1|nr:Rrf2 family transcriptional regulator [Streptomyces mobaraensis]EMF02045.1 HTH-type transcriptional repressor nsrR [Streptomyces mobaraensis NBRC 13819 = DSM 40847]QTT76405.1 Rrf2 family transcriptional regulator [Streptomyces mobaraensis NBRC 13819 = DSM 40847]